MPTSYSTFHVYFATALASVALLSCSNSEGPPTNARVVGRYVAHYDAKNQKVTYETLQAETAAKSAGQALRSSVHGLLDYGDSTGLTGSANDPYGCAIRDYSKAVGEINWCMALLDPDSCGVDYNTTTKVLSFYAKLVNKSDQAENPTTFHYTDTTNFPQNTTFYAPFQYKLSGLEWDFNTYPQLVTAVNTNLTSAECGGNGLTLTNDDDDTDGMFDCIYPDQAYSSNDTPVDPGWDFSSYVADGVMSPGEDTGCVLFMQYTLLKNDDFSIYFDLLASKSDGTPPSTPTVSTPTNNSYANTSSVTVSGSNCTPTTGTVYVEGGSSSSPPSVACSGGGTFSLSVPLKLNQANTLVVYQIVGGEQSAPAVVNVTHDNIAPTVVTWNPANGETVVDVNVPCIATFSEPMDTSTFNTGSGTGNNSCNSLNFGMCQSSTNARREGTVSFSNDLTQAVYTLSSSLSNSTSYTCNAKTASGAPTTLKDLAGNALSPTSTITFTSGTAGQDLTAPYIKNIFPADNSTISTNASFYVYFSEPVQAASLTNTNCSGGSIPNLAVWQTNSCVTSGYPTPRPNPVEGAVSLNAAGDIATFTPKFALSPDDCLAITVSSCVLDLAGNALPARGSFSIGAYNETLSYNSWNIFYTSASGDATSPTLVHTGPALDVSSVARRVFPLMVFSEPIAPSTVVGDYIYLTVFGNPTKISGTLTQDPYLQVVTFKPAANLTNDTNHVLTVTGNVADTAGNLMAAPQTTGFTTASTADSVAPTVSSVTPTNGATVSRCTVIDVNFSEPMDVSTLHGANVRLLRVSNSAVIPIHIQVSDDQQSVRLTPEASLQATSCGGGSNACRYRPTISGVKDRSGNTIAATFNSVTFRASTDVTAPTVSNFVPASGSTLAQNGSFAVFFSEAMDRSTLTNANFSFGGLCSFQSVFPSQDGTWAVVNCYHTMTAGSGYSLTLAGSSIRDRYVGSNNANCENAGGNTMGSNPSISFNVSGLDTIAPTVSSVNPSDGTTSVSTSVTPSITFSEALDPRTVSSTTVFLIDSVGNLIGTTPSLNSTATTVTLTPKLALTNPGIYYIIATTALRDLGGGNAYDGNGGETTSTPHVLRTCFSTSSTACP